MTLTLLSCPLSWIFVGWILYKPGHYSVQTSYRRNVNPERSAFPVSGETKCWALHTFPMAALWEWIKETTLARTSILTYMYLQFNGEFYLHFLEGWIQRIFENQHRLKKRVLRYVYSAVMSIESGFSELLSKLKSVSGDRNLTYRTNFKASVLVDHLNILKTFRMGISQCIESLTGRQNSLGMESSGDDVDLVRALCSDIEKHRKKTNKIQGIQILTKISRL